MWLVICVPLMIVATTFVFGEPVAGTTYSAIVEMASLASGLLFGWMYIIAMMALFSIWFRRPWRLAGNLARLGLSFVIFFAVFHLIQLMDGAPRAIQFSLLLLLLACYIVPVAAFIVLIVDLLKRRT